MAPIVIPREQLSRQLREAFAAIDSEVVCFHTDLMEIGIVDRVKSRTAMLSDYESLIQGIVGERCLLFAAFNYQFCRDGIYDVIRSPVEVGILNDHVRQLYPGQRTRTPVFNFCVLRNRGLSLAPVENPFSEVSTFGELAARKAQIVLFGAGLDAATFLHHAEEVANIGYRYIKPFPGEILEPDGTRIPITLRYRVRPFLPAQESPLDSGLVYDWPRLEAESARAGILREHPLGHGRLLHARADTLLDFWAARLKEDELYMLTPESRRHFESLFQTYGYPLIYERVEGQR